MLNRLDENENGGNNKTAVIFTLKENRSFKSILDEAEKAHPNDEEAQILYGAELMKRIGFDVSEKVSGN